MSWYICMYVQNLAELRIVRSFIPSAVSARARRHTGRAAFVGEDSQVYTKAESGDSDGTTACQNTLLRWSVFRRQPRRQTSRAALCRQREYKKLQMYTTRLESGEHGVSGLRRSFFKLPVSCR